MEVSHLDFVLVSQTDFFPAEFQIKKIGGLITAPSYSYFDGQFIEMLSIQIYYMIDFPSLDKISQQP